MKLASSLSVAVPALALFGYATADLVTVKLHSATAPDRSRRAIARSGLRAKRATATSIPLTDWIETVDLQVRTPPAGILWMRLANWVIQWYGTISVGTPPQNL